MSIEFFILEVVIILFLILINGFLSASELSIIAVKRSDVAQRASDGDRSAILVKKLKENSERFLATVQIGITVVGTMASAIGGVLAIEFIKPLFLNVPVKAVQVAGDVLAIGIVVIIVSYTTLILGELVPKSLALRYSERIAYFTAKPVESFARIAFILVNFLTKSTNFVLFLLRVKDVKEKSFVSEEDVKFMLKEGREKGIFDETEQELIHSVFEFTDTTVREVMVPRSRIQAVDIKMPSEKLLNIMVQKGYTRYPVYEDTQDNIVGLLFNKDVLRMLEKKKPLEVKSLMRKPYFVPETVMISSLLSDMQLKRYHLAIVINEHGEVDGLVTIEDLLEEIVGEIEDEYPKGMEETNTIQRLKDGSLIIDASIALRDLEVTPPLPIEESDEYDTLAGYVLYKLQKIPKGGEVIKENDYKYTIVDMEGKRIAKVKVEKEGRKKAVKKRK